MLSGIPANSLIAFRIKLDAACISGEFFPVTMTPFFNCRAAPAKTPSFPFPFFWASMEA